MRVCHIIESLRNFGIEFVFSSNWNITLNSFLSNERHFQWQIEVYTCNKYVKRDKTYTSFSGKAKNYLGTYRKILIKRIILTESIDSRAQWSNIMFVIFPFSAFEISLWQSWPSSNTGLNYFELRNTCANSEEIVLRKLFKESEKRKAKMWTIENKGRKDNTSPFPTKLFPIDEYWGKCRYTKYPEDLENASAHLKPQLRRKFRVAALNEIFHRWQYLTEQFLGVVKSAISSSTLSLVRTRIPLDSG